MGLPQPIEGSFRSYIRQRLSLSLQKEATVSLFSPDVGYNQLNRHRPDLGLGRKGRLKFENQLFPRFLRQAILLTSDLSFTYNFL